MSDENNETQAAETKTKKKSPQRKSMYVCVPVTPVEQKILDDDGFEKTVLTVPEGTQLYAISVCEPGKGQKQRVEKVLEESGIDLADGDGGALLFRAKPLSLQVKLQPKLKFV